MICEAKLPVGECVSHSDFLQALIDDCDLPVEQIRTRLGVQHEVVAEARVVKAVGVVLGVDVGGEVVHFESIIPNGHLLHRKSSQD